MTSERFWSLVFTETHKGWWCNKRNLRFRGRRSCERLRFSLFKWLHLVFRSLGTKCVIITKQTLNLTHKNTICQKECTTTVCSLFIDSSIKSCQLVKELKEIAKIWNIFTYNLQHKLEYAQSLKSSSSTFFMFSLFLNCYSRIAAVSCYSLSSAFMLHGCVKWSIRLFLYRQHISSSFK